MALIKYREWHPSDSVLEVINRANEILDAERADGYTLTLRQLYYKFVSQGGVNSEAEYKRLGRIISDARASGLMDWDAIEDRGRNCYFHSYSESYEDALSGLQYALGVDPWANQDTYLEVWVEKQALESVVARPCRRRRAPYMACKGYLSASESWRAGQRFEAARQAGKRLVLIHLGDFDPSGLDMTRDNAERLEMFSRGGVDVQRVALNWDQIRQYRPPPNPAKVTDSRYKDYVDKYGEKSWELDALPNRAIDQLILSAIDACIDPVRWEESMEAERRLRRPLALLGRRWREALELVTSTEKPLDRLAAIDRVFREHDVHHLLHVGAKALGSAAGDYSRAMQGRIVGRIAEVVNPHRDRTPDDVGLASHDGFATAIEEARAAAAAAPPVPPLPAEVALAEKLTALDDDLETAMMRVSVSTDAEVSNDYTPGEPDVEFGDEYEAPEAFPEDDWDPLA